MVPWLPGPFCVLKSGIRESNPSIQLGKLVPDRSANPAKHGALGSWHATAELRPRIHGWRSAAILNTRIHPAIVASVDEVGNASLAVPRLPSSRRRVNPPMLDEPRVKLTQADHAGQDNVLRLATVESLRLPAALEVSSGKGERGGVGRSARGEQGEPRRELHGGCTLQQ